jgi:transposase-like protein
MSEAIFNRPHFQDADAAREYLESIRWPNGPVCPHCGSLGKHLTLTGSKNYRPGLHKCGDCYEQFTVTVGTVFERSKIGLHVWLQAVHLMAASKKGVSAKQLERMLGVTYKTAWFMAHRIREAMKSEPSRLMGGPGEPGTPRIVEVDETYYGTATDKNGKRMEKNRASGHKMKIVSLVERNGEKRTFHVPTVTGASLKAVMSAHISPRAYLMTDESSVYRNTGWKYHEKVNHSANEYVRGIASTNTVEGSFSLLKRGLNGTFHSVSEKHLQRYCDEFDFRWNTRMALGFNDTDRANITLKQIAGKRLTYRRTAGESQALA